MRKYRTPGFCAWPIAALGAIAPSAWAGPSAYDGFAYTPGAGLDRQNGGIGFNSRYAEGNPRSNAVIRPGSLSFGSLVTSGHSVYVPPADPTEGWSVIGRKLSSASYGADNTTLWASVLIRPGAAAEGQFGGFTFTRDDGLPITPVYLGEVDTGYYAVEAEGGWGPRAESTVAADPGAAAFLVLRFNFVAGNDTVSLFVNPTPGPTAPTAPAGSISVSTSFNYIEMVQGMREYQYDELRIGTTWADVAPDALRWDPDSATGGDQGGAGTWNTSSNWWTGVANATWTNSSNNAAAFAGPSGGAVAVGTVTAYSLHFYTPGYVLDGGTITLTEGELRAAAAATINSTIAGFAGIGKTGPAALALGGINTFSGDIWITEGMLNYSADANLGDVANSVRIAGGTLAPRGAGSLAMGNTRTLNFDAPGGAIDVPPGLAFSVSGPLTSAAATFRKTGAGSLTISGPQTHDAAAVLRIEEGRVNINSDAGAPGQMNLSIHVQPAGSLSFGANQHLRQIAIDGSDASLPAATAHRLVVGGVSMLNGARFDLVAGAMIVQPDTLDRDTQFDALVEQIRLARNADPAHPWSGTSGLTSTAARDDALGIRGLGIILNQEIDSFGSAVALYTTFLDESVTSDSVLVRYTYAGDADLDGDVDAGDYFRIDRGVLLGASSYRDGDFNYDQRVDADDYSLIDWAYLNAASKGPASGPAAVPEPSILTTLAAAVALCTRRVRAVRPAR